MLDRIWNWCRHSATIVIARAQVAAGALIVILDEVATFIANTNTVNFLPPKWLTIYLVASGIVTELARRRTLAG